MKVKRSSIRSRRGVAVMVALGLMAITLAVAYTLLRTQSMASAIQANAGRGKAARQASLTGIQVALKRIHDADWGGVDVPLNGSISATDTFTVTFATGDAQLSSGDDDWKEYPFRLTLRSVGTSVDPADANRKAEYVTEVVVNLIRERIADAPADWNATQANTMTQWKNTSVSLNFPCRIEGPVRIGGVLNFCNGSPPTVRPFDGLIDEVAILDKDLDASELTEIYYGVKGYADHASDIVRWWRLDEAADATLAVDATGVGNGVYEGGQPGAWPSPRGGSGSARFDGEVDGIALGNVDVVSTEMTLLAWFRADDFGSSDARIISKSQGTSESQHTWMLSTTQVGSAHRLRFRLQTAGGTTSTLIATSGNLPTGSWVFAAATFDGEYMRLYLNGVLVGEQIKVGTVGVNALHPVSIGENGPGSPRGLYFRHLNRMQEAGLPDYRPFNDALTVTSTTLSTATRSLLTNELGLTLVENSAAIDYSGYSPAAVTDYQLYPGGSSYEIVTITAANSGHTLEPDMTTNPLGVFSASGDLVLGSKTTIRGSLLATADVEFGGTYIVIEGVDIPPLSQSTERIQLPAVTTGDDLEFLVNSTSQIAGMLVVSDCTRFASDSADMTAALTGRLLTGRFDIYPRSPWSGIADSTWDLYCQLFDLQRWDGSGTSYLPEYLNDSGLKSEPVIKLAPPAEAIRYHWHDWSQPLYLPASDGDGLRWNIVRWTEGV